MATTHEILIRKIVTSWSVNKRGRLYSMRQGLAVPVGCENPIWYGPYPGSRQKGFPDIFGFEFVSTPKGILWGHEKRLFKLPIYCVIEVKTKVHPKLSFEQKHYLTYVDKVGGNPYVAMEDDNEEGYILYRWNNKG